MNTERLLKVKEHILEEPLRLDMDHWFIHNVRSSPCGTVGCIAGWTCLLSSETNCCSYICQAVKLLDIGIWQAVKLFYTSNWQQSDRLAYDNAQLAAERAKIVGEVIDRFISEHA